MIIDLRKIKTLWFGGIKEGRKEKIVEYLNKLNLNHNHVEPIIHTDGVIGCKSSAKKVLNLIRYNSNGPFLVLEDDCTPTKSYNPVIEVPDNADALYVGTSIRGLVEEWKYKNYKSDPIWHGTPLLKEEYKDVFKIENMLSTHAIIYITNKYMHYCYNVLEFCIYEDLPYDVIYADIMKKFNVYAVKRPLFYQDCDCNYTREDTLTPLCKL